MPRRICTRCVLHCFVASARWLSPEHYLYDTAETAQTPVPHFHLMFADVIERQDDRVDPLDLVATGEKKRQGS